MLLSPQGAGRRKGRVSVIKVHFPQCEAGGGDLNGTRVCLTSCPLIGVAFCNLVPPQARPQEMVFITLYKQIAFPSRGEVVPEQPEAWPTDHRGLPWLHGAIRGQEPPVSHPGQSSASHLWSGTSPRPALWQLLWVRSALNGLPRIH